MTAGLLICAVLRFATPTHAEDEAFEPSATTADTNVKSTEDIDLFLKGLNEATDQDAQLAEANAVVSDDRGKKQKATAGKVKKHKRAHARKEATNDN